MPIKFVRQADHLEAREFADTIFFHEKLGIIGVELRDFRLQRAL